MVPPVEPVRVRNMAGAFIFWYLLIVSTHATAETILTTG